MIRLIELSHELQDVILELRSIGVWEETISILAEGYEELVDQIDAEGLEDE